MFASSWLCALSTVVIAGRFGEFRLIMRRSCLVCGHNKRQLPYNADRIIRWPIRWYSVDVGKIGRYAIIVLVTQSGFTWRCDAAHAHRILKPSSSSLEMKKKLIKICIWRFALYGSETWTVGKNEERIINAFETWCWRKMLKITWTDRITNDEVFQRAKEEKLLLKILKNSRH